MIGPLIRMIEIYKPNGIDWMGYEVSKKNPYTFHHIIEEKNGGKAVVSNGAILTYKAHVYLNYLENLNDEAYYKLNNLFLKLNRTGCPPTKEYFEELKSILENAPIYVNRKENKKNKTRSRSKKKSR